LLDFLGDLKRTQYCGELRAGDVGKDVVLMGWVHRRRDHGQVIFIDLRDRAGIAQIVFNRDAAPEAHAKADTLRAEFVAAVEGRVVRREKPNAELPTGEVEVLATRLHILNNANTPPFTIEDDTTASEETRLRYRYLDLRRPRLQRNLALRHRIVLEMRKTLDALGFYEIETPMLTRSTPEGARDYLVPSRIYPGQFYALPQSPQIFKQILMISGLDRYFQIVRCFRDEDLRADRQPDFTQLDLEMSFVRPDDVFEVIERVMEGAFRVIGVKIERPFRRMLYQDAIRRYGSDKPDLRFGMELVELTQQFEPARAALGFEGAIFGFVAPGAAAWSRKQLDEAAERGKASGARGVYTVKVTAEGNASPLEKTLGAEGVKKLVAAAGAKPGDLVVAASAKEQIKGTEAAAHAAGQLRLFFAEKLNLIPKDRWELAWLTGFPLFEWSETDKQWISAQHPFTGIVEEDLDKLETAPWEVRSKGYDLVLNGTELGSGSVRIHRQDIQARIFRALGLSDEQARQRFGFFLDALGYGTPPHGGIALGLDRVAMLLAGEKSLRDVIAFPKTAKAQDLMAESPSAVDAPIEEELEIMAAYPGLEDQNWALAHLCDRLTVLVNKRIFDSIFPKDTHFQQSMSLIISKARDDARAVIRLSKSGYGLQAAGLSRSLVESAINSLYIGLNPETHGDAYLRSIRESNRRLVRGLTPHADTPQMQAIIEMAENIDAESGWPRRLIERVDAIGRPMYLYDVVYLMLSQILHGDIASVAGRLREDPDGNFAIQIGPSNHWVPQALATSFIGYHEIAHVAFKAFGIDETELDHVATKFQELSKSLQGTAL
jgi:aspartyl-tRNA synthetase